MPDLDFGDDAFCPIQAKAQETLCVFPSILTPIGRKGGSPKQDEGVAAYPIYGAVKVSTGIVRYGKRVAVWARSKTYNFLNNKRQQ